MDAPAPQNSKTTLFTLGATLLIIAAAIAIFTALAHSACIVLGPSCYAYQLAPEAVIESAQKGTLLAPLGTLAISAIFLIWAAYGLSAAGVLRRLPLLPLGIYTIACLCILRGLLGIQLWLRKPELLNQFATVSNWVWFITGVLFLLGYRLRLKAAATS